MLKCFNTHTYKLPHKYILEITIKQHKSIYLTIPWFFRCQCYSLLFHFESNINTSFHQYLIVINKFLIVTQLYLFILFIIHLPQPLLLRSNPQYLLQIPSHSLNISIHLLYCSCPVTCLNLPLH